MTAFSSSSKSASGSKSDSESDVEEEKDAKQGSVVVDCVMEAAFGVAGS